MRQAIKTMSKQNRAESATRTGYLALKKVFSNLTRPLVLAPVIGSLLSCAALSYGVRAYNRRVPLRPTRALPAVAAIPPTTSALAGPSKPLDNPPPARLPVLHITVRPWGFEPKQITRQKGDFALWVDNRSGLSELNVHLIRETGEAAQDRQIYKRRYDWLSYYDLTPGRYVLTEADHRQWECRITITAN